MNKPINLIEAEQRLAVVEKEVKEIRRMIWIRRFGKPVLKEVLR